MTLLSFNRQIVNILTFETIQGSFHSRVRRYPPLAKEQAMSGYAINHCDLTREILAQMSSEDYTEQVMNRVAEVVADIRDGQTSKPHELRGIEVTAQSIAWNVVHEGARMIASDLDVDIEQLKTLASSQHISSC